ncbi:DUF4148 domain-containing protein [Caballeronia sp. LZ043]|uniref:DUF4148 domain-containing protein n=1 Tax=Caballeronia sp. LZ043 TaxID=3038569 RepID=UPI002867206D|nr:DUF4148 domain-containing protein [Caballeronia sp. LZ043]MDR5825905.1 DUF4148 domain-containing protein [Caballeronia sp. LZ043]
MSLHVEAAAVIVCALLPALAQAENSPSITRAQVGHELLVLEQHGYQPNRDDYPVTLEQARQAIAQQRSDTNVYGLPAGRHPG